MRRHLAPVVGDIVFHAPQHLKGPQPAPSEVAVVRQQAIRGAVASVGSHTLFAQPAQRQPRVRVEENAAVQVVAPAIDLVGIVGQVVIFKAVDPTIVVQVNAEQKLRAIGRIAEEGFFVIRDAVVENAVVVLVEVGDKIVVLVPPREDGHIAAALRKAEPIGRAVLVVVVVNQLVQGRARIVVGDVPAVVDDKRTRRVIRVHAVRLAEKVKRRGHL